MRAGACEVPAPVRIVERVTPHPAGCGAGGPLAIGRITGGRSMRRIILSVLSVVLAVGVLGPLSGSAPARAADVFPARIALPDGWRPEGMAIGEGAHAFVGSLDRKSTRLNSSHGCIPYGVFLL